MRVDTGSHFMLGDHAIAEGALAAGCNFFAGYPITPASPIAERMSWRMNHVDGDYIQLEDEIASMAAIIGASCAGAKAMTATSGPGLSLMLENIGLAYMMEVPCVVVNVMRGGPSTGMPTLTSQGDVMQAKWGSHGDYEMISYCPSNVQEMFDFTVKSFNLAERYRTPVILLADQILGLMTSNLTIPHEVKLNTEYRKLPPKDTINYKPYDNAELIPPMALAGMGYKVHMTGLTHNEFGYPAATPDTHSKLMSRIRDKFILNLDEIIDLEKINLNDCNIAFIAYGSESQSVKGAIKIAEKKGLKIGLLRLKTIWPFPIKEVVELSQQVRKIIVPEINMGQIVHFVREYAHCEVISMPHPGGSLHSPEEIYAKIKEVIS